MHELPAGAVPDNNKYYQELETASYRDRRASVNQAMRLGVVVSCCRELFLYYISQANLIML